MTKWVTVERDYKNQGIEIKVSCERANLSYTGFQNWDYKGDVEQELYEEIEREILGGPLDPQKMQFTHYSNRNLENLIVTECVFYPPLEIGFKQMTSETINQHKARQIAIDKLIDLAWNKKLKERELKK